MSKSPTSEFKSSVGVVMMRVPLDPAVVVHSLRVTALTTARERGAEIIDLQDWVGHADPRTTPAMHAKIVPPFWAVEELLSERVTITPSDWKHGCGKASAKSTF
jgi:hypothetical protein